MTTTPKPLIYGYLDLSRHRVLRGSLLTCLEHHAKAHVHTLVDR